MYSRNHIVPLDFAEYHRKWDFSDNTKTVVADFYEMDFIKGIFLLLNVDKMYNWIFWKVC